MGESNRSTIAENTMAETPFGLDPRRDPKIRVVAQDKLEALRVSHILSGCIRAAGRRPKQEVPASRRRIGFDTRPI